MIPARLIAGPFSSSDYTCHLVPALAEDDGIVIEESDTVALDEAVKIETNNTVVEYSDAVEPETEGTTEENGDAETGESKETVSEATDDVIPKTDVEETMEPEETDDIVTEAPEKTDVYEVPGDEIVEVDESAVIDMGDTETNETVEEKVTVLTEENVIPQETEEESEEPSF